MNYYNTEVTNDVLNVNKDDYVRLAQQNTVNYV